MDANTVTTPQFDLLAIVLNDAELAELMIRLSRAGGRFCDVGSTLARVALARTQANSDLIGDAFDLSLWAERERYVTAMDETHQLGSAVRLISAVRKTDTAQLAGLGMENM